LHINIENTEIDEPLRVFPNPFTSELNIVINSKFSGKVLITLTNSSGQRLYSVEKEIIKREAKIEITNSDVILIPSIYYLNINGPGIKKTIPVIKLKK
jgi:hypothetical protein